VAHIIWDWNGTLFDDLPLVVESVNACLRSRGVAEIDLAGYRDRFERPLHRFYEGLLGCPIDDDLLQELDDEFQAAYDAGFDRVDLHPEALPAIRNAAAAGVTQSIASMMWHHTLVPTVRRFGVHDHMVALDGNRGLVDDTKEHHLAHHVERLGELFPGGPSGSFTVIGDIVDDARAAAATGIGCVLFDGGSQKKDDLLACGVPVVGSLLEAVHLVLQAVDGS
jgi:phosphoglycolate phosphatase-like HAD superfamily hydrolase